MPARPVTSSDSAPLRSRLRRRLVRAPIVAQAVRARDRRRLRMLEESEVPSERSRRRWLTAAPNHALTWGAELSGDAAIEAAVRHGVFGEGRSVLEIGPGYGRILEAALARDLAFDRYVGVDLSAENVRHLGARFDDPRAEFIQGDVVSFSLEEPVDAVHSYLTFKHLYPSIGPALANIEGQLRPGGRVVFDLMEGARAYFEHDEITFIREYGREEIPVLVREARLELVTLDRIVHAPGRERILVVAEKPV